MSAQEKLIEALEEANAPAVMIARAKSGYYGDFTSPLAMPIVELVTDTTKAGLLAVAERAKEGEFDG